MMVEGSVGVWVLGGGDTRLMTSPSTPVARAVVGRGVVNLISPPSQCNATPQAPPPLSSLFPNNPLRNSFTFRGSFSHLQCRQVYNKRSTQFDIPNFSELGNEGKINYT
ncbi:hypothetical protein J6590_039954 [Homalodisca vitripennis]|nr:hypothetical protein J6590_039954 [Homalodisca vitripennis]